MRLMKRDQSPRVPRTLLVVILCCSILCQILGVSISFYNLEGPSDLIEASQLEGFSITSGTMVLSVVGQHLIALMTRKQDYRYSYVHSLFRPPIVFVAYQRHASSETRD
jgi:amino acid permease